jgi:hypothetical protein
MTIWAFIRDCAGGFILVDSRRELGVEYLYLLCAVCPNDSDEQNPYTVVWALLTSPQHSVGNVIIARLIDWLFTVLHLVQGVFTYMKLSPLQVKGRKI